MSNIKPSDHGIVVEHKESGVRYAISDVNFTPDTERKVRDLKAHESVMSYIPKAVPSASTDDQGSGPGHTEPAPPGDAKAPTK